MDNHRERIGNFRIEPPGLFRGRGNHPKMGMLKRRIRPEDVIINCSKWVTTQDADSKPTLVGRTPALLRQPVNQDLIMYLHNNNTRGCHIFISLMWFELWKDSQE